MSPEEWLAMGGGNGSAGCQSEWSLSTSLGPEQTNVVFKQRERQY
jgi:hypothetical protein